MDHPILKQAVQPMGASIRRFYQNTAWQPNSGCSVHAGRGFIRCELLPEQTYEDGTLIFGSSGQLSSHIFMNDHA